MAGFPYVKIYLFKNTFSFESKIIFELWPNFSLIHDKILVRYQ